MGFKQAIIVRNDLGMGKGKIAAQCSHAAVEAFLKTQKTNPKWAEKWLEEGQQKIVLKADSEKELLELFQKIKQEFPVALVKDAGLTQLTPGTVTCFGVGPVDEKELDEFIKDLKLL